MSSSTDDAHLQNFQAGSLSLEQRGKNEDSKQD